MRPFLMLIFSGILVLVGRQSRTADYDEVGVYSTTRVRSRINNVSKRGDDIMYRTTPINRNKVLQGLQNLKFDDVESYRTHVFEKHSVMNDKENLNMVLQGNKKNAKLFHRSPRQT